MKILRLIARLNVGGPARHVIWLTNALQDEEFESVLVSGSVPRGESDMAYFADENGVQPVYIEEMSRELSIKDITSLIKIFRIIRKEQPDIVHTHTAKAGTLGRGAVWLHRLLPGRKKKPIKAVHTFHGHVFHSYYGRVKTRVFITLEQFLARFATSRIVVISQQQFREINEKFRIGRAAQFEIIPLGIDLREFDEISSIRKLHHSAGHSDRKNVVVGLIGRLTEIKNIGLLLKVAALVKNASSSDVRLEFEVIGDGHLRKTLEKQAALLGINDLLTFSGNKTDSTDIYAGLDIVAITSLNEGTPLSLIEAMAAGIPVISTSVGGVTDLLGEVISIQDGFRVRERGVSINTHSEIDYEKGLIYLAKSEKLREELASRGRRFVELNYGKNRLVSETKEMYRKLIDRN